MSRRQAALQSNNNPLTTTTISTIEYTMNSTNWDFDDQTSATTQGSVQLFDNKCSSCQVSLLTSNFYNSLLMYNNSFCRTYPIGVLKTEKADGGLTELEVQLHWFIHQKVSTSRSSCKTLPQTLFALVSFFNNLKVPC